MRVRVLPLALASLLFANCAAENHTATNSAAGDTVDVSFAAELTDVSVLGEFTHEDLKESSSAVASRLSPGVFWTHNDAGNDERLFAFDSTGQDLGRVRITGAKNRDWEAMASGPCAEGACLYIGDVGDNLAEQKFVTVYRVKEPAAPGRGKPTDVPAAAALRFRYPDGAHDVESMWVDADTSIWLATKRRLRDASGRNRQSLVFRVPASAWMAADVVTAELADSLPMVPTNREATMVTDAAISNPFGDGDGSALLAVRTYGALYIFESSRTGRPGKVRARCSLASLREPQGEAVAWLPDGRVLLGSEKLGAKLHAARCEP